MVIYFLQGLHGQCRMLARQPCDLEDLATKSESRNNDQVTTVIQTEGLEEEPRHGWQMYLNVLELAAVVSLNSHGTDHNLFFL